MELRLVAEDCSRVARTLKWMRHLLSGSWVQATKCVKMAPTEPRPDPPPCHSTQISAQR